MNSQPISMSSANACPAILDFCFERGMEKASSIMQVLARPFSLAQIYSMFPYFGNKFASGSIEFRVDRSDADLRDPGHEVFRLGLFVSLARTGDDAHISMCQAAQGIMAAVPVRVHRLPPATLTELSCIANDEEWCQWDIQWPVKGQSAWRQRFRQMVADAAAAAAGSTGCLALRTKQVDDMSVYADHLARPSHIAAACDVVILWGTHRPDVGRGVPRDQSIGRRGRNHPSRIGANTCGRDPNQSASSLESQQRETLIQEQITFVESRHEELREAYLEQELTRVALRQKVAQLTALHRAGLLFSSTLDREALLQKVLEALTSDLQYDRAMISFYDPVPTDRQGCADPRRVA